MSTLLIWHNRFSKNENEVVEAHIPQHRDSKTKKPRNGEKNPKKTATSKFDNWNTMTEKQTNKRQHCDTKTFFQRTKSHDINIPRLKNHNIEISRPKSYDIEFLRNSDPYAPDGILSAILIQVKSGLRKTAWFKPGSAIPNFLQRDNIHFPRPYWNILSFTANFMKKR